MPYQTGQNISVRYKVQSALGTPASGSGGKQLSLAPSPGLSLLKTDIANPEVRSDGMTSINRHGSRRVEGSYATVARVAAADELLEAVMRSTWTAAVSITNTQMTSITTTTSTIVAAAGSWITEGVRVGDIVTLTGHATTANNNKRLPVLGVTASTITVPANSLTLDAVADTSFTLTVAKRLGMGVTKRYFTVEEYHADLDQSELFADMVLRSLQVQMQPDNTVLLTFGMMGRTATAETTGTSPVLTDPTVYETAVLEAVSAGIYKNGVALADLSSLDFTLDAGGVVPAVIGATSGPDVFLDNAQITGSLGVMRQDLSWLSHFLAEDELALHILLKEPEAAPEDFLSFFLPVVKLNSADAPVGSAGPMIQTMNWRAGKKPTTSGFLDTMLHIATSAA